MRLLTLSSVGCLLTLICPSCASEDAASPDLASAAILTELHETILTVLQPTFETGDDDQPATNLATSQRHIDEKERLLKRLDKSTGKWNNHHPRYRLLDAMHGFVRYYDRQNEEIERLKGLYKKVSKPQKKVRNHDSLLTREYFIADMKTAFGEQSSLLISFHQIPAPPHPQPSPMRRHRLLRS
jgi:hypothetical protein